MHKATLLSLPR